MRSAGTPASSAADESPDEELEPPESEDGIIPVSEVPEVELARESGDVFAVDYGGFTETGAYQVVVYAEDDEGQVSIPRWVLTGQQQIYLPLVVR